MVPQPQPGAPPHMNVPSSQIHPNLARPPPPNVPIPMNNFNVSLFATKTTTATTKKEHLKNRIAERRNRLSLCVCVSVFVYTCVNLGEYNANGHPYYANNTDAPEKTTTAAAVAVAVGTTQPHGRRWNDGTTTTFPTATISTKCPTTATICKYRVLRHRRARILFHFLISFWFLLLLLLEYNH